MSLITEEYITSIIGNIAPVCNLSEWSYTKVEFTSVAQNYFGVLIPVVLSGKIDKKDVHIPLVLKLAPTDERYRVSGALGVMFARETFVYSVLLKQYREMQRALSLSEYVAPECYYVRSEQCKEALAMQDMTQEGYKPYTHTMFLDFDHARLSLESLAKFHAFSFIMKHRDPIAYGEAIKVCVPTTGQTNKRFMEILKDRLDKAEQKFEGTEYVPLLSGLRKRCVDLVEAISSSVEQTCICHGDIWKENILFKYEDEKPVSACLIDYQTARVSSPAFDALYLITSSTKKDLRHHHFQELLELYYGSFSKDLKEAKLESQNVYPRESFERDLKTVGPACFITANTALWLANGLQQEGHVRSKIVFETEEARVRAVENYKALIKGIIDDFQTYDYLCSCLKHGECTDKDDSISSV